MRRYNINNNFFSGNKLPIVDDTSIINVSMMPLLVTLQFCNKFVTAILEYLLCTPLKLVHKKNKLPSAKHLYMNTCKALRWLQSFFLYSTGQIKQTRLLNGQWKKIYCNILIVILRKLTHAIAICWRTPLRYTHICTQSHS